MNPVTLYLLRHGAVLTLEGKRYIGQLEAPLSERGIEQSWALRNWLDPVEFSQAHCSDLARSQRTAKIVLGRGATPVCIHSDLREISLGVWEGASFREVAQKHPAEFAARGMDLENWRPTGGESFGDCKQRVLPVLRELLEGASGNLLLVGHAGVNRIILSELLGIPLQKIMSIRQDYGCVNVIEFRDGEARLQLLNYSPLDSRPLPAASTAKGARRKAQ